MRNRRLHHVVDDPSELLLCIWASYIHTPCHFASQGRADQGAVLLIKIIGTRLGNNVIMGNLCAALKMLVDSVHDCVCMRDTILLLSKNLAECKTSRFSDGQQALLQKSVNQFFVHTLRVTEPLCFSKQL